MTPLGKVPVAIQLGNAVYKDDLHIYPGVSGALISWKAAKGLGILHPQYPYPGNWPGKQEQQSESAHIQTVTTVNIKYPTAEDLL